MDWKQRGRRDSPAFHGDKCAAATLTETKCEQICTRKREITFAHLNPRLLTAAKKGFEILHDHMQKKHMCIHVYWEEGGGRGGGKKKSKRRSGKEIYNSAETFAALPEQKQQQ